MKKGSVLIVDDEEINRMLLQEYLKTAGYDHAQAANGTEALAILRREPRRFSAILLDRMMPDMDGLTVLKEIKQSDELKDIPVIMQTAKAMKEEIREGLECGSYYYLTKPFDKKTLLTILQAANDQFFTHGSLIAELEETSNSLSLMKEGAFELSSLDEARNLSKLLALSCPEPSKIVTGLSELLINAIEHGNLAISFDEKTELIKTDRLYEEISRRLLLDENKDKRVMVEFKKSNNEIHFDITDCGAGFDHEKFVNIDLSEVLGSHGRGIAMAKLLSFSEITYSATGNQVKACVKLQ
ncbi:MAG: response regulator [Gammaproteobacteria bacterium]|nr:response regulator [Gammaproteobacteria bacterium]